MHNVQEVDCSARALDSTAQVLSMSLFTKHDDRIVASANVAAESCLTAGLFVSCLIDEADSRKTRLRALIVNPSAGEEAVQFGCNVTTFVGGGRINIRSWFISVARLGKYVSGLFAVPFAWSLGLGSVVVGRAGFFCLVTKLARVVLFFFFFGGGGSCVYFPMTATEVSMT